MLKLTYLDNGFNLEIFPESLESWVNKRVLLALRSGTNIHIQATTAAFLVQTDFAHLSDFINQQIEENIAEICPSDGNFGEISLKGFWVTSDRESETGIFVTNLLPSVELLFHDLQQNELICTA
jgi:hypothetical protein